METPVYIVSRGSMTLVVLWLLSPPTTGLRTFVTDRHENAAVGILRRRIEDHEDMWIQLRLLNNCLMLIRGFQLPTIIISMRPFSHIGGNFIRIRMTSCRLLLPLLKFVLVPWLQELGRYEYSLTTRKSMQLINYEFVFFQESKTYKLLLLFLFLFLLLYSSSLCNCPLGC